MGIDVGGTFTDLVALEPDSGALRSQKVLTTAAAPARGVLDGLAALTGGRPEAARAGIAHGTTIVTNAVVEGK